MSEKTHVKSKRKRLKIKLYNLFHKTKGFDPTASDIPNILTESIEWLEHNREGIFRIPGPVNDIKHLKSRYDKGKKNNLKGVKNPHTVAGLIKIFFRQLAEPISTFELYISFLESVKTKNLQSRLIRLKMVINALPPANKLILHYLCKFLNLVSQHTSNCMNVNNLSIIFAPNLFRSRVETISSILSDSCYVTLVVRTLIEYQHFLFYNEVSVKSLNIQPNQPDSNTSVAIDTSGLQGIDSMKSRSAFKATQDDNIGAIESKMADQSDRHFHKTLTYGTIKLSKRLMKEQDLMTVIADVEKLSEGDIKKLQVEFVRRTSKMQISWPEKNYNELSNSKYNSNFYDKKFREELGLKNIKSSKSDITVLNRNNIDELDILSVSLDLPKKSGYYSESYEPDEEEISVDALETSFGYNLNENIYEDTENN